MVRWLRSIRTLRVLWGLAALGMALGCIAPSAPASAAGENPKYVFLFIGDGMGMPQINAAEIYLKSHPGQAGSPTIQKLALSSLPVQGMCTTYSANSFITDSAPAATSLASGFKTDNGIIGMDPPKKKRFVPVSRMAKEKGRRVGVVSSVSIDHATPAAFYASVPSRKDYYDISRQLVDSGFDYFAGGGLLQPKGKKGDQPSSIDYAKEKGYRFVDSREEFLKLRPGEGKVLIVEGEKAGVFRDREGRVHAVNPTCTHLGCVVAWNSAEETWDCPCHGSLFDLAGRVYKNRPAPDNLVVPPHKYLSDTRIVIGEDTKGA